MRKFELAGLALIAFLLGYRIIFGSELQVVLRIALTLISIFYLWFGFFVFNHLSIKDLFFTDKRKLICKTRLFASIVSGLVYSLSFISVLFVVNFYNGMQSMSILSLVLNAGVLSLSALLIYRDTEMRKFARQFLWRSLVLCGVFFIVVKTPVDQRLNVLFKEHPRFIEAYKNYMESPDDPEVQNKLREERSAFR